METWLHHIDRIKRKYNKAFTKDPLFGAYLKDRIQKNFQVFLHSCNTAAIEDMDLGSLKEFGGIQKKVDRGEWLTSTLGWVDWTAPKEEGRWKSDRNGIRSRPSGGGGGRDAVFNNGVDLHLRIMERLGEMTAAERSENLHCPLAAYGR